MSEYYKSEKGYYYKKTKKNKSRITKEEYGKAMNGGVDFFKSNTKKRVIENKNISDRDITHLFIKNNKTNKRIDDLKDEVEFLVKKIQKNVDDLIQRVTNLENQSKEVQN
tara:strand:+ start:1538 stop:1867 length:330 start_codon:yes stop_codon:yes gene_type:complete